MAEENRPVRGVRREGQWNLRVDAVGEERDDRGGRDNRSDAREGRDHRRAPRRGNARAGGEGRKSEGKGAQDRAPDRRPHAEVPRALCGHGVGDRREDEARRGNQEERAGEHEVVEALALAETAVDEERDEERDESRRRFERDVELRARVREREARDEARRGRQRRGGCGEAQGEEANAHSTEENRHARPFRLAFTKINAKARGKDRY